MTVLRERGRVKLVTRSFVVRGNYELCVRAPGQELECESYSMTRVSRYIYASKIDFARHFSHSHRGRYAVKWQVGGTVAIGRPLHFRR